MIQTKNTKLGYHVDISFSWGDWSGAKRCGTNPEKSKDFLSEQYCVSKIGIFGLFVREEQTEKSDIDLLVEFTRPVGFQFVELKDYLESLFNGPVDLVTINALKPYMREEILSEVSVQGE
jgi:predicted nucleotidyltransferase